MSNASASGRAFAEHKQTSQPGGLFVYLPKAGLEPARGLSSVDFESTASTISPLRRTFSKFIISKTLQISNIIFTFFKISLNIFSKRFNYSFKSLNYVKKQDEDLLCLRI